MGDQAARVELDSLAQQLRSVLNNPDAFAGADEAQRLEVKQLARAVSVALEQPFETVQRLAYSVRLSPLDPTSSDSPSPYAAETHAHVWQGPDIPGNTSISGWQVEAMGGRLTHPMRPTGHEDIC